MNNDASRKPIYTVDIFPSVKSFGLSALIVFIICLVISVLLYLRLNDVWFFILCQILVLGGCYIGRSIESRHHKEIMSHMTPEYQKLYKDVAYALAKHDLEQSKKPMVEKDEQTQKESSE